MAKKCSSCNNLVDDAAAFCDICGAPFSAGLVQPAGACPGCGAENLPGEIFCNNCGMLLPPVIVQPPAPPVDNSKPPAAAGPVLDEGSGTAPKDGASGSGSTGSGSAVSAGAGPAIVGVTGRFVVNGSNYTFNFPSGKPELLIGRAEPDSRFFPEIDTVPAGGEAAGVSRRHAKLTVAGGRVYIEDLGSTNFTFVNRQRLQAGQRVPLNPGDEVRLGRMVMLYYP